MCSTTAVSAALQLALKQFETMQALVRQMSGPGAKKRMRGMAKFGGGMPGGFRLPGM